MEIKWFMEETNYEEYRKHQHEHDGHDCDGEYIGSARMGNLCFDILNWGNHLWFDLYVGGVDSGYGYSERDGYKGYPYDYADVACFCTHEDISEMTFDQFKAVYTTHIEEHLSILKEYTTDRAEKINLIDKANEELRLW